MEGVRFPIPELLKWNVQARIKPSIIEFPGRFVSEHVLCILKLNEFTLRLGTRVFIWV